MSATAVQPSVSKISAAPVIAKSNHESTPDGAEAVKVTKANLTNRQTKLIPEERLNQYRCVVIGLGNVGHQLATMLAKMGAEDVTIIDFDKVGVENVYPQGFALDTIGQLKCDVIAEEMMAFGCEADVYGEKFDTDKHLFPLSIGQTVLFLCVDCIDTRRAIYEAVMPMGCPLIIDGRVGAEVMHVLTCTQATREAYDKTLFPKSEASQAPCGARATIYTGSVCAGLMLHQFTRWLRGIDLDNRMCLSLLEGEMYPPEYEDHADARKGDDARKPEDHRTDSAGSVEQGHSQDHRLQAPHATQPALGAETQGREGGRSGEDRQGSEADDNASCPSAT